MYVQFASLINVSFYSYTIKNIPIMIYRMCIIYHVKGLCL